MSVVFSDRSIFQETVGLWKDGWTTLPFIGKGMLITPVPDEASVNAIATLFPQFGRLEQLGCIQSWSSHCVSVAQP